MHVCTKSHNSGFQIFDLEKSRRALAFACSVLVIKKIQSINIKLSDKLGTHVPRINMHVRTKSLNSGYDNYSNFRLRKKQKSVGVCLSSL